MIYILTNKPSEKQLNEMLEVFSTFIKLAVDIERGILAGGGSQHADCEYLLLEEGSLQENIWGADWIPSRHELTFEALINIRPQLNNMSMDIQDEGIKEKIQEIVFRIFG